MFDPAYMRMHTSLLPFLSLVTFTSPFLGPLVPPQVSPSPRPSRGSIPRLLSYQVIFGHFDVDENLPTPARCCSSRRSPLSSRLIQAVLLVRVRVHRRRSSMRIGKSLSSMRRVLLRLLLTKLTISRSRRLRMSLLRYVSYISSLHQDGTRADCMHRLSLLKTTLTSPFSLSVPSSLVSD